jgi:GT2 family glycosyltransferase/glycosyltransferase involved in cell wall biosynthesis
MMNMSLSNHLRKVTFYSNHGEDACAHLRLRGPMQQLGIEVIDGREGGETYPERTSLGDLVIIQRDFPRSLKAYEEVIAQARQNNKKVVFDLDDLLFMLPENHPERKSQAYTDSLLPILQALYDADYVTVATQKIKDELSGFIKNIIVLPNFFDDLVWKMREPKTTADGNSPLIIGFMGSESHQPDIEFITPVLLRLFGIFPNEIAVHFWGVRPPKELSAFSQVRWIPAHSYEYIDFAQHFQTQNADIFIAPLLDNQFNRAKSPLKFFEYSALGVPGIYSRLDPFEQVITHGQDGLFASSHEEWLENLIILIQNPEKRSKLAHGAQETIRSKWLLSQNAHRWQDAYTSIAQETAHLHAEDKASVSRIIRSFGHQYYDLKIQLEQQIQLQKNDLIEKDQLLQSLVFELDEIKVSKAWQIALLIRKVRVKLIPPNTWRAKLARFLLQWIRDQKVKVVRKKSQATFDNLLDSTQKFAPCKEVDHHRECIDVVICVHNAIDDVRACLESVVTHTTDPFSMIIVDDGSIEPTKEYLRSFADNEPRCKLIRNEKAKGYTLAANIGMRASQSPYLILLNSDTIVGPEWLDRMYRAITVDEKIGVVGPLSNTASWQSVPTLSGNGDWAVNTLPVNMTPAEMSKLIAKYSACLLPKVPLLNGFCLMIRRALIGEIGYFDEENFGQGYGEEDDFNLRAGKIGWKNVIADDVYIFHAQSKSYSNIRRYALTSQSGEKLRNKHGVSLIANSVAFMNPNRVMDGIRSRTNVMLEREETLERGREGFSGKRLLIILPVIDAGGGANVIIDEARYMLHMGVDVRIFNLSDYRTGFLENYPHLDVPAIFGNVNDLPKVASHFDAVVASANYSVEWLLPIQKLSVVPTLGYYVQGYEPLMFPNGSEQAKKAQASYTLVQGCKLFTKTEWNRRMVLDHTSACADVVGISVNIDLFRPRDMIPLGEKPVRIVAMIRTNSAYRNPFMTLTILKQIEKKYGKDVDIWLFGENDIRQVVHQKYLDFNWRQLGKLTQHQVATMMSRADIFTDFSTHQAMGLTTLEAMSAGCSVIVPKFGGAIEFVNNRENGIVIDTSNFHESLRAVEELVEDDNLRTKLQIAGIMDVVRFYPEKASYNILKTLFTS